MFEFPLESLIQQCNSLMIHETMKQKCEARVKNIERGSKVLRSLVKSPENPEKSGEKRKGDYVRGDASFISRGQYDFTNPVLNPPVPAPSFF